MRRAEEESAHWCDMDVGLAWKPVSRKCHSVVLLYDKFHSYMRHYSSPRVR